MPVTPTDLHIQYYPAPVLRKQCKPVEIDDETRAVAERMIELMYAAEGIGLAAPQVGLSWMLFVADVPAGEDRSPDDTPPTASSGPTVFFNPEIVSTEGPLESMEEGCLSLPDIHGDVFRPPIVTVRATGLDGQVFEQRAGGLLGRCIQHEYDHLMGVLILDKMTQMSRLKNRSALRRMEKQG